MKVPFFYFLLLITEEMSTVRTCIRKVTKFLDQISDDGTLHVAKRRGGHQRLVALYGGQKRSFIVPSPSTTNVYENKWNARSIVLSLPFN